MVANIEPDFSKTIKVMPNMETENSSVSRAEELKALANEAFRGTSLSFVV